MNTIRVQKLVTTSLCGLALTCLNLFAQSPSPRVPVGHPIAPLFQFVPSGPLPEAQPQISNPSLAVTVKQSYDGADFNSSGCGCLPPDTNAAVGGNYVAESVNFEFKVFDKTSGAVLLDESLASLFGAASGGDPYVLYDELADRWYVNAFDSSDAGLFIAVSNDNTPIHGFKTYDLNNIGGFPDYAKPGYNKDAVFIAYNDFGSNNGYARIISINKANLLGGTLTYFLSTPANQFRAMPPAQLHGDTTGGVEWFVSTDGTDSGGTTMRVTKMTNYLGNSPSFTYTSLTVPAYQNATTADQPGGPGSVTTFPNTTTTQVQYRKGHLLTAMASGRSKDGFRYPKGMFFEIDVTTGTPVLKKHPVIDPGPRVAVQMPSADEDIKRHVGLTWIESSSSEYVSMWVGGQSKLVKTAVAPGLSFMADSFRIGDYSSTVIDPTDGVTFWSANEYVGANGGSDIWNTHLAAYTIHP